MKSVFVLLFSSVFLFSIPVQASFSDIQGMSSFEAVEYLQSKEIIQGFGDGTFRPEKHITRAEFLKIAFKDKIQEGVECTASISFSDVSESDWFFPYVCYGVNQQYLQGYRDGTFRPHDSINVRDAAKIVSLGEELEVDDTEQAEWFIPYVHALTAQRVMPQTVSDTAGLLTRGEMSEVIWGIRTGNEVERADHSGLPEITSCEDLTIQLQKFQKRQPPVQYMRREIMMMDEMVEGNFAEEDAEMAAPVAQKSSVVEGASGEGSSARDFSQTNVQEFGVDEADIVKNDGSHIFLLKGNTVRIISAYPADNLEQTAILSLSDEKLVPREMFLDGDMLTVIGSGGGFLGSMKQQASFGIVERVSSDMIYPPQYGHSSTAVVTYDVSDRSDPQHLRTVRFDGDYISSRKINDIVYLISQNFWNQYFSNPVPFTEDMLPAFFDSAHTDDTRLLESCGSLRYVPNFTTANALSVAAIDTRNTELKVQREVVLGGGNMVYASPKNIYISNPRHTQSFREKDGVAQWTYEQHTEVYKFSLENESPAFIAKGRVLGSPLNQFSMSEYDDVFRIATQVGNAWGNSLSHTRVTLLDTEMKKISEVTDIAPGENMKSARFMGKKGYLVTFKTVDPLFVLDLTPSNPKVLGKLKIPGWSDYLHPYDENHLIGFGKEVDESIDADKVHSDNAVYYTAVLGMKLSIFDVSDVENPKETHKHVIGYRGTTSSVLQNHKALLFDKAKGILAFPITITENKNGKSGREADVQTVFSGAQVYDVSLEDGFSLRGQVSHYLSDDQYLKSGEYFYGDQNRNIQRIMYIGDSFFTISPNVITSLSWDNISVQDQIELDEVACNEIRTESECVSKNSCSAVYYGEGGCIRAPGEDIVCEELQFSRCQSVEK